MDNSQFTIHYYNWIRRFGVFVICLFCIAHIALGSEPEVSELNEVVVTGTRAPKSLKNTPVQTKLISSRDIERTDATDIRELLQQTLPGAEFSYAMNQQTHLNFGGFAGQSLLFLIDGERLAGETMDDIDFSRISMANVERVEIVRGASSALYGSNAGGGVINIITQRPEKRFTGYLDFRTGKHNDRRYIATISLKSKVLANSLSVTANTVDSYNVFSKPGAQTRVFSTVYGQKTLSISDKLVLTPVSGLDITARAGFHMRELPREINAPERYRSYSAGLRGQWSFTPADMLEISYSFDQYDKSQFRTLTGLETRTYSDVLNALRTFYTHTFPRGDILSAGADYSYEYLLNQKLSRRAYHQTNFDIFSQYDCHVLPCLEAVATLRYDRFSQSDISRLTPKLTVKYAPTAYLTLRAAWGMGFRAPSLKERYYEFDMAGIWIVKGNPALKPEECHNLDFSADITKGNYNLTISAFYNDVKNRIANSLPYSSAADPTQIYLDYINLDRYKSCGLEIFAKAFWSNGLSANIGYNFTHESSIKDSDGKRFNNQYMPTRPHAATANIEWRKSWKKGYDFSTDLSARILSSVNNLEYKDYYDLSKGTIKVKYPSYALLKLTASQTITRHVKISVTADNLLNYRPKYYYLNAPLTDGINLLVGVTLSL